MSFGWNVMFRTGSWLEFRRFALTQRKNMTSRLRAIDLEMARIGSIKVVFAPSTEIGKVTEKRVGLEIQAGTSLGKLLRAYVARGGNYYDISMFLTPDSYEYDENGVYSETQPFGGVIFPEAKDMEEDTAGLAGALIFWKEPKRKQETQSSIWDSESTDEIGGKVLASREWISQEIKELRNDLEARILKLCDLREQLMKERSEIIVRAVGGSVPSLEYNPEHDFVEHNLSQIVSVLDRDFFEIDSEGKVDFSKPREFITKTFPTLLEDAPTGEEKHTAL